VVIRWKDEFNFAPERKGTVSEIRAKWKTENIVWVKVLTAIVMKYSAICDISPYNLLKTNQRFGVTFRFRPQVRRISQARNQHQLASMPRRQRRHVPPELRLIFNRLNGVVSHIIGFFTTKFAEIRNIFRRNKRICEKNAWKFGIIMYQKQKIRYMKSCRMYNV
jgi:hypothetical protein